MKKYFLKFLISNYNVISFDIFDTLIERTVDSPIEIFRMTGRHVLGKKLEEDFCLERRKAESEARANAVNNEVTLDEIYEYLNDKYLNAKNQLMKTELKLELEFCRPKHEMIQYFEYALQSKKEIYLISDMYLSVTIIKQILDQCKITGYHKLYVSNEYRKNKITGALFKQVITDNNLKKETMLHIGDSIKADFIGAHKAGLHTFLIGRKKRLGRWLKLH